MKRLLRTFASIALTITLTGVTCLQAFSTELPPGLIDYLVRKDKKVQVRFDGLVTFSNGITYVPVFPQDPNLPTNPGNVVTQLPKTGQYPKIIGFDNHLYLLKVAELAPNKFSLPQLLEYPLALKEGLLPQDLLLPSNLYIPSELRIILGALPYNYDPTAAVNDAASVSIAPIDPAQQDISINFKTNAPPNTESPDSEHLQKFTFPGLTASSGRLLGELFLLDLKGQSLVRMRPESGVTQTPIALKCIPSSLSLDTPMQRAYVTCLTTDELIVVNLASNLIQARVKVGSRPEMTLALPALTNDDGNTIEGTAKLVVSNRFSNVLSVIDANNLAILNDIELPAPGGRMLASNTSQSIFVANANSDDLYEVDTATGKIKRTLKGIADTSDMWLNTQVSHDSQGHQQLWITSRSQGKVLVLDLVTGEPLKTLVVGDKPSAITSFGDYVYVVSSDENKIDIIEWRTGQAQDSIPLEDDAFPNAISISPNGEYAYVSAVGSEELFVINLPNRRIQKRIATKMRTIDMAIAGNAKEEPGKSVSRPVAAN